MTTQGPTPQRLRRGIALLMMLIIGVVSFSVVMHRAARAAPVALSSVSQMSVPPVSPAQPGHRMVPPGAVNSCPFSSCSLAAIPASAADSALPAPTAATTWRLGDMPLPRRVESRGLYRPPRSAFS